MVTVSYTETSPALAEGNAIIDCFWILLIAYGNSLKSLHISVTHSLRKLQTDYIDLLYVHWWDFTTSVEEVMHGLNALQTNAYARAHGLRPFSVYQGKWNARCRDMERGVIPMCRDQGMAIAPWAPLGQGRFKTAEAREAAHAGGGRSAQMSEDEVKVSEVLEAVAQLKRTSLHAVVEHLLANIETLNVELSREDMDKIDTAISFDPGFPMNFIFQDKAYNLNMTAADVTYARLSAHLYFIPLLINSQSSRAGIFEVVARYLVGFYHAIKCTSTAKVIDKLPVLYENG
ncbi:hypothetical protein Aspvir_002832 [Aspergillus viridinutans]|uniref:NADP-dependent oxidoreductase domain-containing protein n=1 Tax=Aspergillus viridinutans TaxID=75553 RepID=A0A9P3C8U7_ASPVI|nr:uncharacterized protein Aspvir_002832 [Aspergillus viridinutans]GIK07176.1 hypothetical protein Aspvir_002832 [Aspergillus viridinutans]